MNCQEFRHEFTNWISLRIRYLCMHCILFTLYIVFYIIIYTLTLLQIPLDHWRPRNQGFIQYSLYIQRLVFSPIKFLEILI